MAYTKTNWVNGTTPLNDKNMNKIENALENLDTNMNKKANSSDVYTKTEIDTKLNTKQEKLTAGTGIEITGENIINNIQANYSTNEQKIGKWIDGKPLYRKVIQTTMAETSKSGTYANKDVDIGLNIDFGFIVKAILISGTQYMSLPYINNAGYSTKCFFDKNVSHLILANGNSAFNNCETYVIIEYTKTTD